MTSDKEILKEKFSSDPDKYYRVALFDELGYERKKCSKCGGYYWTLDRNSTICPEQPCNSYTFLGDPPTSKKLDYTGAWNKISDFFEKNGHKKISRYPVVCRWRPDLFFTVASIVDFQRVDSGKVVFEFPENPLVVPQMCLRFVDIGNVGITGRHYSSFCMVGQQALANEQGYWKDRCIDLDFKLLNQVLGIPKEEVVFKEDVWLGPGAFGNSLEFHVRGLELGNAVFTGFEGTPKSYKEYREKVVDMGAGLERFCWITQGTPTSYDSVFPRVVENLKSRTEFSENGDKKRLLFDYYRLAGSLDVEHFKSGETVPAELLVRIGAAKEEFMKKLLLLQAIYSIADHVRTLLFAISDGALPSNVGGGYNLRVVLRRAFDFSNQIRGIELSEVAEWHAQQLKPMYPELSEHLEDIRTIFDVELKKYELTKARAVKIVESLGKRERIDTEKLIELYDSDGITPESLRSEGLVAEIPPNFYTRVTERHMAQKHDESSEESFDVHGLPETELVFYENRDLFEFDATVQRVIRGCYVILDKTCFYARSGGQEPDHGEIGDSKVIDVVKTNGVVVHEISEPSPGIIEGKRVHGEVDSKRRKLIMRHHTATHVVNGAARRVLGSWVWQHSAYKDEGMGRLDVTHYSHLTRQQLIDIEQLANRIVRENLPVTVTWFPRNEAEQKYGFRIYQGGVVPSKDLRIVNVQGWDVEACGGTHCSFTGDIGLIKLTKSERVQDGVERLEFVAGEAALNYVEKQEEFLLESASKLETPAGKLAASITNLKENENEARRRSKLLARKLAISMADRIPLESKQMKESIRLYISTQEEEGLDSEYHVTVGEILSIRVPELVYLAVFVEKGRTRIIVFSGTEAQKAGARAGELTKAIAQKLGGSGGGSDRFGQGGSQTVTSPIPDLEEFVRAFIDRNHSCA